MYQSSEVWGKRPRCECDKKCLRTIRGEREGRGLGGNGLHVALPWKERTGDWKGNY